MKMEEIHGISIKSAKIHKICGFCVTETHETAECTKPYELLLRIGGFEPRTTFFIEFRFFVKSPLSRAKRVSREKVFPSAKPHFPAAGGCGNVNLALCFML